MLSDNLKSMRSHFTEFKHSGMQLDSCAVVAFCAMLEQATADARALEQAAISILAQAPEVRPHSGHFVKGMVVYDGGRS